MLKPQHYSILRLVAHISLAPYQALRCTMQCWPCEFDCWDVLFLRSPQNNIFHRSGQVWLMAPGSLDPLQSGNCWFGFLTDIYIFRNKTGKLSEVI